jgi:hypothetical protein
MFFIYKTNHNFSFAPLDKEIQSVNPIFIHNSNHYENKICLFGKFMAIIAIILAYLRLSLPLNASFYPTILFDSICIFLAFIMNTNALIYIIPLIIIELFITSNAKFKNS